MSVKKVGPFTVPLTTPWKELSGVGKVRRVVFWVSMLGNLGLIASSQTAQSDAHISADGTRHPERKDPDMGAAPPQRKQAAEDPADEKRDEPEQQEGTPTPA